MFSAVAVGLQLERRLESSERFMFPIARPLPLRSWFSRFLLRSGNLQFKTHKRCCDCSREITAEVEALAVPPRSPLPGDLSGDWEQLSAALFSVFVCLLSERIAQPKEITFLGASGISLVLLHPISLSLSLPLSLSLSLSLALTHTHIHTIAMTGWYGCKRPTALLSVVFFVPQFKHTGQTKATLWLPQCGHTPLLSSFFLAAFCFSHSPAPESMSSVSHLHKNSHFSLCFQKPRPMSFSFWSYGSLAEYIDDQLAPWTPELE